jgi:hypothetical protein
MNAMREMDRGQATMSPLHEITNAATEFGLSSDEILGAMNDALRLTGTDVSVTDYLDELSGTLARRILAKQRQARFSG